ncbi:MAG: hypothetical protein Q9195_009339 [Heterodermia aff. obscurata]
MAPCEVTEDYYATLELPQTATVEAIKRSYRQLSLVRHPDRNPNPDATSSFQCLQKAYETLIDPAERRTYDLLWVGIRQRKKAQEERAEVSKNEQKRAAEERARKQKEQTAWLEQLEPLEKQKSEYETKIFEGSRVIRQLAAALKRLQERDDEDLRKESERNSWWTFITSPIYGKQTPETEEQKQQREFHRLQRLHSKSIKEKELIQQEANVHNFKDRLQDVTGKIAAVKRKREDARLVDEARMQERLRKEQEAKRWAEAEAERERQAKLRAEWEAESARRRKEEAVKLAARQAKEAQEAEEARKRARVAQEIREAQNKMLAQKLEERARAAREAAQKKKVQEASSRTIAMWFSDILHSDVPTAESSLVRPVGRH